jgi:hypothetical protein
MQYYTCKYDSTTKSLGSCAPCATRCQDANSCDRANSTCCKASNDANERCVTFAVDKRPNPAISPNGSDIYVTVSKMTDENGYTELLQNWNCSRENKAPGSKIEDGKASRFVNYDCGDGLKVELAHQTWTPSHSCAWIFECHDPEQTRWKAKFTQHYIGENGPVVEPAWGDFRDIELPEGNALPFF